MSCPVLVSNVKPLNSYIVDGKNGFLFCQYTKCMVAKISYLMSNKRALNAVKLNANSYAKNFFAVDANAQKFNNIFSKVLN